MFVMESHFRNIDYVAIVVLSDKWLLMQPVHNYLKVGLILFSGILGNQDYFSFQQYCICHFVPIKW